MTQAVAVGFLRVLLGLVLLALPSLARAECASGTYACGSEYCTPNGSVCCASAGHPEGYCPSGTTCTTSGQCQGPGGGGGGGGGGGTCDPGTYMCASGDGCCPSGRICGTSSNGCGVGYCCDPDEPDPGGSSGSTTGGTPTCSAGRYLCAAGDGCCPSGTVCGTGSNGCGVERCCDPSTGATTGSQGGTSTGTSGGTTSGGTSGGSSSSTDACVPDTAPDGCDSKDFCCGDSGCWVQVDGERFSCDVDDCYSASTLADEYCMDQSSACSVTPRTPVGTSQGAAALPLLGALVVLGRRRGRLLARGVAAGGCVLLALLFLL